MPPSNAIPGLGHRINQSPTPSKLRTTKRINARKQQKKRFQIYKDIQEMNQSTKSTIQPLG
jgi:hypothetical protein